LLERPRTCSNEYIRRLLIDFELITNYNVESIIKFLDDRPQLWDKAPDPNVHDSPNYKSINHKHNIDLDLLIEPIVEDLISRFGGKPMQRSITLLPANENIREHADEVSDLRRFHIAIKTNEEVIFHCGNSQINIKVGECWEFDYKKWHKVLNNGKTDRIHLLVDLSKNK